MLTLVKKVRVRRRPGEILAEEEGGAAVESALLFTLAAVFAVTMKTMLAGPLVQRFVDAAKAISRALTG